MHELVQRLIRIESLIKEESKNIKIYKINNEKEKLVKEFNTNVKIKLTTKLSNNSFTPDNFHNPYLH